MGLLFRQDWHLFSPDPGISIDDLWVRCQGSDGAWHDWVDPIQSVRDEHYGNRLTVRGKLLYVYNHISKGLKEVDSEISKNCSYNNKTPFKSAGTLRCDAGEIAKRATVMPVFKVAQRFASDFCLAQNPTMNAASQVQFKIMTFFPKNFSERNEKNIKWSAVNQMLFPAVALASTIRQ